MILTANSEIARQTARRKSGNGWHTTFIGQNRNTLKAGEAPPEAGTLYPMAFLVEKEPHAVVRPHFHQADQYQVVVQGGGRLGTARRGHGGGPLHRRMVRLRADRRRGRGDRMVHPAQRMGFRRALHAGCPRAASRGADRRTCITVRQRRRRCRLPRQAELSRTERVSCLAVIEQTADGMATWRYRLPAGRSISGPEPREGGGQFWIVLSG